MFVYIFHVVNKVKKGKSDTMSAKKHTCDFCVVLFWPLIGGGPWTHPQLPARGFPANRMRPRRQAL